MQVKDLHRILDNYTEDTDVTFEFWPEEMSHEEKLDFISLVADEKKAPLDFDIEEKDYSITLRFWAL